MTWIACWGQSLFVLLSTALAHWPTRLVPVCAAEDSPCWQGQHLKVLPGADSLIVNTPRLHNSLKPKPGTVSCVPPTL